MATSAIAEEMEAVIARERLLLTVGCMYSMLYDAGISEQTVGIKMRLPRR